MVCNFIKAKDFYRKELLPENDYCEFKKQITEVIEKRGYQKNICRKLKMYLPGNAAISRNK